ncbi:MAG: glutamate formimidoyltransferase [Candidatus Cloacimonas sp. 4484_209]|nr:MAG: glutamate formimidoyltransferase [Candidatus Cloacimonas sp. 4484_209]
MDIIECVPNFSEGKDKAKIKQITDEIEKIEGVKLLDVDPGEATNRTVVTFVGTVKGVKEAAFRAIKKAAEVIDMRKHKGAHARMGATDVCPFVPVSGVTMDDCVQIANEVGERVAKELSIPVYLYEEAAKKPERKNLANIRAGEYEGLPEKLKDPEWKPDYGEPVFNEKSGATVIGAREFLIAYNINLNTKDRRLAHEIALNIREKGRAKRDKDGKIIRDENGKALKVPGKLKAVKAVGWYIDEYGIAQISVNLINYKITPLYKLFEVCRNEARKLGLRVTGSELVGLIPKEAMLEVGRYYLEKQGRCPGVPEEDLIMIAVTSLGMDQLYPFKPEEKIIEYTIAEQKELQSMNIRAFSNELSTDSPAPGGGSVAALSGALGASLTSMVANLTYGRKGYNRAKKLMKNVSLLSQNLKDEFLDLIEKDTDAFNRVMDSFRMPKKTDEDKKLREEAIEDATKEATLIPLEVMKKTVEILDLAEKAERRGNQNSVSDAGVAAIMANAACESAYLNVIINLGNIKDDEFKKSVKDEAEKILKKVKTGTKRVKNKVIKKLL